MPFLFFFNGFTLGRGLSSAILSLSSVVALRRSVLRSEAAKKVKKSPLRSPRKSFLSLFLPVGSLLSQRSRSLCNSLLLAGLFGPRRRQPRRRRRRWQDQPPPSRRLCGESVQLERKGEREGIDERAVARSEEVGISPSSCSPILSPSKYTSPSLSGSRDLQGCALRSRGLLGEPR